MRLYALSNVPLAVRYARTQGLEINCAISILG